MSKERSAPRRSERPRGVLAAAALTAALAFIPEGTAWAAPVDCGQYRRAAEAGKARTQTTITVNEAATKEALDAAKRCLANIDRALNGLIPGVRFSFDFSGILAGMIDRACQVVTSRIDSTGNVINGTVSGATNRVIGTVNNTLPGGSVSAGTTTGTTTGTTNNGLGGGGQVGAPPPRNWTQDLGCSLTGTCRR